jgi:hypothetical protein
LRSAYLARVVVGALVDGPAWTGIGLEESAGRYPLRVEAAVGRLVGRLLPGVITTTRHARMYCVHALAWAEAAERQLDRSAAEEFVRRCEVVMSAIHHFHQPHRIALSSAHGEERVPLFVHDETFDVERAARRGGLSEAGFAGVYVGPCLRIGAVSTDQPPRRGARADLGALRAGLGDLLDLAVRDRISLWELRAAAHLCTCEAASAPDGRWLRRVLLEEPEAEHAEDRYRQLTCLLMLETLHEQPSANPARAFRERWAFGELAAGSAADERVMVASLWRAAELRNYSVSAWRALWRWLAAQLNEQPMTAEELGERLADALDDVRVLELLDGLPPRIDANVILPAESDVADEPWSPTNALRQLALGSQRLEDLTDVTLQAFVGTDPTDLGPRWVAGLLDESRGRHVRDVARELAIMLVRRAKRVALSKMYMTKSGRPFVPTRLRDRDGILSVRGEEGGGALALRTEPLAHMLAGLGILDRADDGTFLVSDLGEELRARIG